jgi:MFS transporter, DHA1 family, multidrug resistance protein
MALQTASYAIILPLFARRMADFGAGVAGLGLSSMAYAVTSTLAAPLMGALADRRGRRPFILVGMGIYVVAFSGYWLAPSALVFILLRGFAGALTAGLTPSVLGIIADLAPAERKGQWIGIVNGGMAAGWIIGPLLGGGLYDRFGYSVPFLVSIAVAMLTLGLTFFFVPETRWSALQRTAADGVKKPIWKAGAEIVPGLSRLLPAFLVLMGITLAVSFAATFVEPQFMFYAYGDLSWTSAQMGFIMSIYGIASTIGGFTLARLSDRWGRKTALLGGLGLVTCQYLGMLFFRPYVWIAVSFGLAGLGNALYDPALSAALLDISPPEHRARTMGVRSMAASLGNVLGPALVVILAPFLQTQGVFMVAAGLVALAGVTAVGVLPAVRRAQV